MSGIVRKFSELYPHKRGQFFHVSNERNNQRQVFQSKALGIFPGVSDLLYFDNSVTGLSFNFILLGLEVKAPGTYHKKDKVRQQVEWGKILESKGGIWRLVTNIEDSISCIEGNYKGLTTKEVEDLMNLDKKINIKF